MMANKVEKKIEEAKNNFHADGLKAHQDGDHKKSEELLNKALDLLEVKLRFEACLITRLKKI